ncbi:MAG: hypothetical protein ACRD3E_15815 [Terriglobales bacterium]
MTISRYFSDGQQQTDERERGVDSTVTSSEHWHYHFINPCVSQTCRKFAHAAK